MTEDKCTATECNRRRRGRGQWCDLHRQRAARFGDPNHKSIHMVRRERIGAFWEEVLALPARADGPCIEWPGARNEKGYGVSTWNGSGESLISRAVWTRAIGPIPAGLLVCHHCDNPPCARPSHLFLGTHQDNADDMVRKGRAARRVGDQNARTVIPDDLIDELRQRWLAGETCKALAEEVGIHPASMSRICRGERRITTTPIEEDLVRQVRRAPAGFAAPRKKRERTPLEIAAREARDRARAEQLEQMKALYSEGLSTPQVGQRMGLNGATVYRKLAAAGVRMRSTSDYHPAPDAEAMAARYRAGAGIHDVAREFHVTTQRATSMIRDTGTPIRRPGRPKALNESGEVA